MLARKTRMLLASTAVAAVALCSKGVAYADDLQAVQASNVLRVAMSGQYSPFSFANEKNEIVGFDASIGEALAQRLGVNIKIITTPFDGIIA
ncbi:transporter substrate-binding domain-containing protein, partial [Pseudomonas kurunegalensis]